MKISVNGSLRELQAGTVPELISELELAPETVLVELNGLALHRSEWPGATLAESDRVEILRVAAGG